MSTQAPLETQQTTGTAQGSATETFLTRVMVTGATGFVGRAVVRELVARGHKPICLVRDRAQFESQVATLPTDRREVFVGDLFNDDSLARSVEGAEACIHLVGIIREAPLCGQTFERIHVEGTQRVVAACKAAGVKRIVHMSALGARSGAVSNYHKTKWLAEGIVRDSGIDWTIFRPSLIHGPDGEFMRMIKKFVCQAWIPMFGFLPTPFPVIPYFGDGNARLQPVSVKDVAACFVAALSKPETIRQTFELGGPEALTWKEFYRINQELIPGAKQWKRLAGMPVGLAKVLGATLMKMPLLPTDMRFDVGQVQMSQEDSVCDTARVEKSFGIRMRDFRDELTAYANLID